MALKPTMDSKHRHRGLWFVSLAIFVSSKTAFAGDVQQRCLVTALNSYNAANLAIIGTASPILSVEEVIAQRRLEEKYCLQVADCLVGDANNPHLQLPFAAEFSKCLRDEATEKDKDP